MKNTNYLLLLFFLFQSVNLFANNSCDLMMSSINSKRSATPVLREKGYIISDSDGVIYLFSDGTFEGNPIPKEGDLIFIHDKNLHSGLFFASCEVFTEIAEVTDIQYETKKITLESLVKTSGKGRSLGVVIPQIPTSAEERDSKACDKALQNALLDLPEC